jgi:SAM-dependent methyltransferase
VAETAAESLHPLTLTGERTLPGIAHEQYWFARHLVAYRFAADVVRGAAPAGTAPVRVLDGGCGEGYGAELLRRTVGAPVVALDYDAATAAHVRATYPRVTTVRGNLVALPLRSASCSAVVSLQTVEHLWDQAAFAGECRRVLEPGGTLVVSTPNRLTFAHGLANPFHARELDPHELRTLVEAVLDEVRVLGVHHGPRLAAFARAYGDPVAAQLAAPPDGWDAELTALVTSVRDDDFVVAADGDDHRLVDALDLVAVAASPAAGAGSA